MTYNHFYAVSCQMCGDDPNVTCTCNKKVSTIYIKSIIPIEEEKEIVTPVKIKKKRLTRIQKQSMYGGS